MGRGQSLVGTNLWLDQKWRILAGVCWSSGPWELEENHLQVCNGFHQREAGVLKNVKNLDFYKSQLWLGLLNLRTISGCKSQDLKEGRVNPIFYFEPGCGKGVYSLCKSLDSSKNDSNWTSQPGPVLSCIICIGGHTLVKILLFRRLCLPWFSFYNAKTSEASQRRRGGGGISTVQYNRHHVPSQIQWKKTSLFFKINVQ